MPERKPRQTILAVDDDLSTLEMLRLLFELENYTVLKADRGEKAIEVAKEHSSQIKGILLDIMMPEISGEQVAEILGETPETSKIPILLVSGNIRFLPKLAQRLHEEKRLVDYLGKPFEPHIMIDKMANLIKKSKR